MSAKKRVLVVDDEVMVTGLLKLSLERTGGLEVRVENSAVRAPAAAREFRPDILLLDLRMPDGDGEQVAKEIRSEKEFQTLPVIFFSGAIPDRRADIRLGGCRVLPKPSGLDAILRAMEQELGAPLADVIE